VSVLDALGVPPAGVQPLAWSPEEWGVEVARGNAIAREAADHGLWLVGRPAAGSSTNVAGSPAGR
jgi:hypothetical protein